MKRFTLFVGLLTSALVLPLALDSAPAMARQQKAGIHTQLKHKEIGKRHKAARPAAANLQGGNRQPQPGTNFRALTPEEMSEPGPRNPYYGGM